MRADTRIAEAIHDSVCGARISAGRATPVRGGGRIAAEHKALSGTAIGRMLLSVAACLTGAAVFLPLWGMTLVSTQYPEGLRMIVYPTHIRGDITEINLLNHYIGMAAITDDFFVELKLLPLLFAVAAAACLAAALVRRRWTSFAPLVVLAITAGYGMWSMFNRLYQFGHDLDPRAPIQIEPFTPPPLGTNQIAQFATYSYFSWGTALPLAASLLIIATIWLDMRHQSPSKEAT
jgi:hypothetical protein